VLRVVVFAMVLSLALACPVQAAAGLDLFSRSGGQVPFAGQTSWPGLTVDDNGNRTSFGYDALNRKVSQTNADGESYVFTFDRDDNIRTVTDPNGSVVTKVYDALNRMTETTVSRGAGVLGTTRETYSYDGLSRLVRAADDNGNAAQATQVTEYVYDSLSRLLEERQNGRAISSRYTGDGKRTQVTYPGGRVISRTFDGLDRIKQLKDGPSVLADTDWIGPGMRELRRVNGNGTALTFLNDAGNADVGYDAVQRLVRLRVVGAGGAIVDREYAYNRASQRTVERRHDDFGLTDRYTYDSAYRVTASSYDQDGLTGAIPRELRSAAYVMDGVGNRRQVQKQTSVGPTVEAYAVNAVNEYVSVAGVARTNDDNGNLTDDGSRLFFYDYKNRLVGVSERATGNPVATYEYLADGRRAKKVVYSQTTPGQVQKATAFFYDGAQEVEEQDAGSGLTEATYVWSPVYVDELVTYTNSAGTFYTHQDARCDVVAITDAAGNVVERVRFDDFGRAEIRGPGGGEVRAASAVGCAYGFQGRRLDAETGLLYFRARMYDPATGRFLQRDPVWDAGNVGGQYTFCGNGPVSGRDPSGMLTGVEEALVQSVASGRMQATVALAFLTEAMIDAKVALFLAQAAAAEATATAGAATAGFLAIPTAAAAATAGAIGVVGGAVVGGGFYAYQKISGAAQGTNEEGFGFGQDVADRYEAQAKSQAAQSNGTGAARTFAQFFQRETGRAANASDIQAFSEAKAQGMGDLEAAQEATKRGNKKPKCEEGDSQDQDEPRVVLYSGTNKKFEGAKFDLAEAAKGRRENKATEGPPAIFLTTDFNRAVTQHGRSGEIARTDVPASFANSLLTPGPGGTTDYKATTEAQVGVLNQNVRVLPTRDAIRAHFSGGF
jgi:RHS repeat-associated protein